MRGQTRTMACAALLGLLLAGTQAGTQTPPVPPPVPTAPPAPKALGVSGAGVKVVTVVDKFPFTVQAPPGAGLYFWQVPSGVQSSDRGDALEVGSAPAGELTVNVKIVGADWDKKKFVTEFGAVTVLIGGIKPTPPDPGPDPKPDPKPEPISTSPFAEAGFRVLICFKPNVLRTGEERAVIFGPSKVLRDYLNAKCAPDPTGTEKDGHGNPQKEWRIWPATQDGQPTDVSAARKVWRDAWNNKGPEKGDWIMVGDGTKGNGIGEPLPKSEAEALTLLKRYGGE